VTEAEPVADAVSAYKRLLRRMIERRPSGTRRRLAAAMGAHPSFVSQIINPALRVPLPAQHLGAVARVLHLSPEEQAAFLGLYARAHPAQAVALDDLAEAERDVVRIVLPRGMEAGTRDEVERVIRDFAERVIALAERGAGGDAAVERRPKRREGRTR
jgi:hypothetical protein